MTEKHNNFDITLTNILNKINDKQEREVQTLKDRHNGTKTSKAARLRTKMGALFCVLLIITGLLAPEAAGEAKAAAAERVDLRFVFTTDLHGNLTTHNYETNSEFNTGSLAKAYTLVKEARGEMETGNSFTFDLGDTIYDYTSETIFEKEPTTLQPIYNMMTKLNYDAITLGNHEFDYGYEYMLQQMSDSSLASKCVVSNVKNAKTKESIFHENMMITRRVTTQSGAKATVKIGVIGETVPVLSMKRENYIGVLSTEDIVTNAAEQAKKLKADGADIVVVLAHTGFGSENPSKMSKDAAYALTKIKDIDVVLAGHNHIKFPSDDANVAKYYNYEGVDKKTGLVNGKNLVMANDRGQSIGLADLTLEIKGKEKKIVSRSSEVRNVTRSTPADPTINSSFGKWDEYFSAAAKNVVGTMERGTNLNNYFGLMEDNGVIQLLNNAKINYALKALADNKLYSNHPIIAASSYNQNGQLTADEFIHIDGEITESNLSMMASANAYVFLYEITGYQIKEWLEWSASAFETTTDGVKWTDETMNRLMQGTGLKSLISEQWLDEWNNFYVIDGVSYTIDPSVKPRYNFFGEKIDKTGRIKNLTYNGLPVADNMKFVLASQPLTGKKIDALKGIESNYIIKGINRNIDVLMNYVRQQSKVGDIRPEQDYNWNIELPSSYRYIVKASKEAKPDSSKNKWYDSVIEAGDQYVYYKGKPEDASRDTRGPAIVLGSSNENTTNQDIRVFVRATDAQAVTKLQYARGSHTVGDFKSGAGMEITNWSFPVTANGIFTVYAEDQSGNGSVASINIENINSSILQKPIIKSYTNRMSTIQGKAEPDAIIYFETADGSYETKVKEDGTFSYALPSQDAGKRVVTYVSKGGRTSDKLTLTVKRTGANQPYANAINNTQQQITGKTNDQYTDVFITAGTKVFVSPENLNDYKRSDKFDEKKSIVTADIKVDNAGNFTAYIPPLTDGTVVWVFGLDSAARGSKGYKRVVANAGPNAPTLYEVSDLDNMIYGRAAMKGNGGVYQPVFVIGDREIEVAVDSNGYYSCTLSGVRAGDSVSTYVKETLDGSVRLSAVISSTVRSAEEFVVESDYEPSVFIDEITNKSSSISGRYEGEAHKAMISVDGVVQELALDSEGYFTFPLLNPLSAGKKVVVMVRMEPGKILESAVTAVKVGLPYPPVVLNKNVYDTSKRVTVTSAEPGRIEIRVNGKKYSSGKYTYDIASGQYVYEVEIGKCSPGDTLNVYAYNSAGASRPVTVKVIKRATEKPEKDTKQ